MANALEERGRFWWFGEAHGNTTSLETSIPGALTISEEGHVKLELEGSLWYENPEVSFDWNASRWLPHEKRIAGRLGEFGNYILLLDLVRTDFPFLEDKPGRQSYEALLCFTNERPFPPDFGPNSFHALRIELKGLEEWLRLESIQVNYEFLDENHTEYKVSHNNHEFEYQTPRAKVSVENLILGVSPIRFSDLPVAEVNIRESYWLVYTPIKETTLGELRTALTEIEGLIALLVGQYFHVDWPKFVGTDGEFETWCTLYSFRGPKGEALPPWIFLWTTFTVLQDKFGDLLSRWQTNLEKYGAGYELYIASLQSPIPHPEHQFVNLVWAIESLHRGWQRETEESARIVRRKTRIQEILKRFAEPVDKKLRQWLEGKLRYAYEPTLEERITDAFSKLPISIDPSQLRSFAARCAKRRNDISHEGGRRPGEDLESFRTEIRELAEALSYLVHALLLHEIGIAPDVLLKIMTQSSLAQRSILPCLHRAQIDLPISDQSPDGTSTR